MYRNKVQNNIFFLCSNIEYKFVNIMIATVIMDVYLKYIDEYHYF